MEFQKERREHPQPAEKLYPTFGGFNFVALQKKGDAFLDHNAVPAPTALPWTVPRFRGGGGLQVPSIFPSFVMSCAAKTPLWDLS